MENKKEMTIPNVSAATDAEQSLSKCTDNSIVNQDTDFKGYEQSFDNKLITVIASAIILVIQWFMGNGTINRWLAD
jgi:hypothetical protein